MREIAEYCFMFSSFPKPDITVFLTGNIHEEVVTTGSIIADFNEQDTIRAVDKKVYEMECYFAFEKL